MDWVLNGDASAEWLSDASRSALGDRYDAAIALQADVFFNLRWPFGKHRVTLTIYERSTDVVRDGCDWRMLLREDFSSLEAAEKEAEKVFSALHSQTVYRGARSR